MPHWPPQAFALWAAQHWEELYEVPDRAASLYEVGPVTARLLAARARVCQRWR